MLSYSVVTALFLVLAQAPAHATKPPVEITECGVIVDAKEAFLSSDLDCSNYELMTVRAAITFLKKVTLNLNGFTLTGSLSGASTSPFPDVDCLKNCTIIGGGGSIVGGSNGVSGARRVKVSNVTFRDMTHRAVRSGRYTRIDNVVVIGSKTEAVTASRRLVVKRSTISENGGIPQPDTGIIRMTSAVVFANRVRVSDSTIRDNAWAGLEADSVRVRNSTVTGNGMFPGCGVTRNCKFDIGSEHRPRVKDTVCGVSLNMTACSCNGDSSVGPDTDPATHNWGICTLD